MVFRTLSRLSASKRIPLIKFRKGGNASAIGGATPAAAKQASASSPAASRTQVGASSGAAIEDWELPSRYWRKPIDQAEQEYINRGGPA